jgi:hypothetical protein
MRMRFPPLRWCHTMMRVMALCVAVLAAQPATAQPVTVQSGEHGDFTRLVLDIGAARDWRLEGGDRQYRLILDPPATTYDIARVFDLIPRSRLADLTVAGGLALSLACPCAIAANRYRQRYLVLDIRAGADGLAQDIALPDTARLLVQAAAADRADAATGVAPVLPRPRPSPPADLQEAAQMMAAQLARAAAAGLLQPSPGNAITLTGAVPEPVPEPAPPPMKSTDPPLPGLPIRADIALDLVMPPGMSILRGGDQDGCTGAAIAMQGWSTGAELHAGLGALRSALFDARDQLQRDAVTALARHYLAFGFGAEAAFWLGQIDEAPPLLLALSGLVDDMLGPHFPPAPDPLACSDDELLWRYLDGAVDPALLTTEEAGRLQRATASLPAPLRDQIAPRVARALLTDGFDDAAHNLRDLLWRAGRLSAGALLRLDRDLGLDHAPPQEMRAALDLALRDAGGEAVAALAHAMAFDRAAGLPVDADRLTAAEAMLRENALDPATLPLWHEVVLAHAAVGDFDRMLAMLSSLQVPPEARDTALTALFDARLAAGDTPALFLLARSFGSVWQAEGSQAGRARVAAIAHLRDLGLTGAADALRAGQRVLILPAATIARPMPEDDLRMAWRAGDWPRIAAEATGPHRAMAERLLAGQDTGAARDPAQLASDLPLLSAQLADSRALRDTVAALLTAPAPRRAAVTE